MVISVLGNHFVYDVNPGYAPCAEFNGKRGLSVPGFIQ